jgi:ankyrin repeat protein
VPTLKQPDRNVRAWLAAAERGDLPGLKRRLAAAPRLLDAPGRGPYWDGKARALHFACSRGHVRVVHWLLERGASPNPVRGEFDWAPLHFAAVGGHRAVVRMLRRAGAHPDIFTAATLGDAAGVRGFLRKHPRLIAARGPDGGTPLLFAGSAAVARLLLKAGADPAVRDRFHHASALAWVAEKPPVARVLLAHGASAAGEPSPLPAAAYARSLPLVRALLAAGARVDAFGAHGYTALHAAALHGDLPMIGFLAGRGARTNLKDREHHATPLGWAEYFKHRRAAALLRKLRAD